jgi:hypothetical protein
MLSAWPLTILDSVGHATISCCSNTHMARSVDVNMLCISLWLCYSCLSTVERHAAVGAPLYLALLAEEQ